MRYMEAWQKGDYDTLFALTCAEDKTNIEALKRHSHDAAERARTLGYAHKMNSTDEAGIISLLLGKAPPEMSLDIPTRVALKQSSLTPNRMLGSWRLSKEGPEYFICLSALARLELNNRRTEAKALSKQLEREAESREITVEDESP